MKEMGFKIFQGKNWYWGTSGDYRILVEHCCGGTLVIVVSGPDKNKCDDLKYKLRKRL